MPSRSDCATVGTDTTVSSRQDRLTGSHASGHRAATEAAVSSRQEALLAGLSCYYSTGRGTVERPHCQRVAVVTFGGIVLCAMCDAMRSAVGRTNAPRKVPGAELSALVEAARALALVEEARRQGSTTGTSRRRFVGTARRRYGDHPSGRPATIRRSRSDWRSARSLTPSPTMSRAIHRARQPLPRMTDRNLRLSAFTPPAGRHPRAGGRARRRPGWARRRRHAT